MKLTAKQSQCLHSWHTEMGDNGQYLTFKAAVAKRAPRKPKEGGEDTKGKDKK